MNITILGSGTWGLALARVLSLNRHHVTVWSKFEEESERLSITRKSPNLPEMVIPDAVSITSDSSSVLSGAGYVIVAVPSVYVRETIRSFVPYIHCNPVRARMVDSADNYRWSGLGAAVHGDKRAIRGLSIIGMDVSRCQGPDVPARDSRLVNGLIFGGIGFVSEMAARLGAKFRGSPTLRKVGRFGKDSLYSSHGGRSVPRRVA